MLDRGNSCRRHSQETVTTSLRDSNHSYQIRAYCTKLNKLAHRLEDVLESYSAAVTTSLHDSKGSYQSSLLHEAKPAKNTAIVASVAAFCAVAFPL